MNVVILGGSFSGLSIAVALARNPPKNGANITIIEPKAYLEIRWATIRSMFEESVSKGCTIPLSKILKNLPSIQHIRGRGISISIDSVMVDNGKVVQFDVLVIATGSINNYPILTPHLTPGTELVEDEAIQQRRKYLRDHGEHILNCKSILVIGGGPVGTELAADIASYSQRRGKQIRVTLIDSKTRLCPSYSKSAGEKLEDKLSALSIDVILNHRAAKIPTAETSDEANGQEEWKLLSTGKILRADLVVRASGVYPGAPNLFEKKMSDSVTPDGWIKTDDYGRVRGTRNNIFAAGDCCDWKSKSGELSLANRNVYAHNIKVTLDALRTFRSLASIDGKLKRIATERNLAIVTSGPKDGVAALPLGSISFILPWMKNRSMFLAKARREIGW